MAIIHFLVPLYISWSLQTPLLFFQKQSSISIEFIFFSLRNLVQACWAEGEAKNIVGQIRGCRLLSTRGDSRLVPKSSSKKMVPARKKEREKGKNHTQDREKRVRIDCASRAAAGTGTLERTQTFFLLLIPFIGRQAR